MPIKPQQPMIPVKKSDGTTVRMTLAEFQAYQKNARAAEHPHVGTLRQVSKEQMSSTERVSMGAREQVSTLPPPGQGSAPDELVASVLKNSSITVANELQDRVRSLILSRIKDVRTDEQFLSAAMTPTHRGGVGLSPDLAGALLKQVQGVLPAPERKLRKPVVFSVPTMTAPATLGTEKLPMSRNQELGIRNQRLEIDGQNPVKIDQGSIETMDQMSGINGRMSNVKNLSLKPILHDVTPAVSAKVSVGPLEEFANFSLVDFRRLGATPDAAVSRLKEKFDIVKQESYLLFMQARDAWYQSPLYREYVRLVIDALRQGIRVPDMLAATGAKDRMTMEVFRGIVGVNTHLSM